MARKGRIIFEGAIYHVYQRGNNRAFIFQSEKHKEFLIRQIEEYKRVFDFQLLAYVIMNNHYHMMIRTNKTPISVIMFNINNVLGKYLNRELNRTGHIFEDRYKCKLVDTEAYLIWLLRYIHRNPVRANLASNVAEYKWSSHHFYSKGINNFVDTDFILSVMSQDKMVAIRIYMQLVNSKSQENDSNLDFENTKAEFQLDDTKRIFEKVEQEEIVQSNIKSLDEILDAMNFDNGVKNLLKNGCRKHSIIEYKMMFINEAIKYKYTYKNIGEFMNTSQPAVSNLLNYHKI